MVAVSTWLITGSSRGIGLQFVRQLSATAENVVIATCRNPKVAQELRALKDEAQGQVHILPLDVTDEESIKSAAHDAADILGDRGLDYLINNAAINRGDLAFDFKVTDLLDSIQSNVVAPALTARIFLPLLELGSRKVITNISSGLASIGLDHGSKNVTYSISKSALNMLTYKQAKERPDLIIFVVDPGWVKTDMGGAGAHLEPQESVTPLLQLIANAELQHSGGFFNAKGEIIPW